MKQQTPRKIGSILSGMEKLEGTGSYMMKGPGINSSTSEKTMKACVFISKY